MKDRENEKMITYVSSYNSCVMGGLQISYKNIIYQGTSSIVVYSCWFVDYWYVFIG